jgi:hypothetical protein
MLSILHVDMRPLALCTAMHYLWAGLVRSDTVVVTLNKVNVCCGCCWPLRASCQLPTLSNAAVLVLMGFRRGMPACAKSRTARSWVNILSWLVGCSSCAPAHRQWLAR